MLVAPLNMHSHRGREAPGPETGKCQPGKGENLEMNKKGRKLPNDGSKGSEVAKKSPGAPTWKIIKVFQPIG